MPRAKNERTGNLNAQRLMKQALSGRPAGKQASKPPAARKRPTPTPTPRKKR
ncbi:MAG: hypothetical protein ACYSW8_26545 [Planctomycetota bacterium]|jgi:hypothetical protein